MKPNAKQVEEKFANLSSEAGELVALSLMFPVLPKSVLSGIGAPMLRAVLAALPPERTEVRSKVFDTIVGRMAEKDGSETAKNFLRYNHFTPKIADEERREIVTRLIALFSQGEILVGSIEELKNWLPCADKEPELCDAIIRATNASFEEWVEALRHSKIDRFATALEMTLKVAPSLQDYQLNEVIEKVAKAYPDLEGQIREVQRKANRVRLSRKKWEEIASESDFGFHDPIGYGSDNLMAMVDKASTLAQHLRTSVDALQYAKFHDNVGIDIAVNAMMRAHGHLPTLCFKDVLEVLNPRLWKGVDHIRVVYLNLRTYFTTKCVDYVKDCRDDVDWAKMLNSCVEGSILPEYTKELQQLAFRKLQEQYSE